MWFGRALTYLLKSIKKLLSKISFGLIRADVWDYPDNIFTPHNVSFSTTSDFSDAYAAAVEVGEFDYKIPIRVHQAIWAAKSCLSVSGDFVEVGSGKGFVMTAVLSSIPDWQARGKQLFLFDLFEKPQASGAGLSKFEKFYSSNAEEVRSHFSKFRNVNVIQGDVRITLEQNKPSTIAFLHVDLNHADAEIYCLTILWEQITDGGIILFDDYANRGLEDQYRAVNEFMASKNQNVLTTASGQGIVIKRESKW